MRKPTLTLRTDRRGEIRYRIVVGNHEVIASSQGYRRTAGVAKNLRALRAALDALLAGRGRIVDERPRRRRDAEPFDDFSTTIG